MKAKQKGDVIISIEEDSLVAFKDAVDDEP